MNYYSVGGQLTLTACFSTNLSVKKTVTGIMISSCKSELCQKFFSKLCSAGKKEQWLCMWGCKLSVAFLMGIY